MVLFTLATSFVVNFLDYRYFQFLLTSVFVNSLQRWAVLTYIGIPEMYFEDLKVAVEYSSRFYYFFPLKTDCVQCGVMNR